MSTIELINLTLNEIRRSSQIVADVMKEQDMILKCDSRIGKVAKEVLAESVAKKHRALEKCRLSLREVLEEIANFQNDQDMVSNVDAALGTVAYDLIYERKSSTDFNRQTQL